MKRFATILALHVVLSAPVSAQEVVRYRAPDGSIKTVSSAEHQSRVGELRTLIDDLDTNRRIVLTMTGSPVVVTNARLHEIAGWLERKGGLTALEVPGWIEEQIKKSREMIPTFTEELEGLTSRPPASVGGAMKVEWPVPMEWTKVKATLPLELRTVCQSRTRSAILSETARLDLLGDASANLVFGVGTSSESSISGAMIPQGSAGGQGRMAFPVQGVSGVFRWQITFNRMNDELVISTHIITYVPDEPGMSCEQTQLTKGEDPDADQFPEPMNWLGTRGEVRGDYSVLCSDGNRLSGSFSLRLDGSGKAAATFEQASPPEQVVATGWIQDQEGEGFAELSGVGGVGRYTWNVRLRREGNKMALGGSDGNDLRVVPNDRGTECYVPVFSNTR